MKIVDLVSGGQLPPKQSESKMGKRSGLFGARSKVRTLHHPPISTGRAESDAVSLIVSAHADEVGAPSDLAFEMIDIRRF